MYACRQPGGNLTVLLAANGDDAIEQLDALARRPGLNPRWLLVIGSSRRENQGQGQNAVAVPWPCKRYGKSPKS